MGHFHYACVASQVPIMNQDECYVFLTADTLSGGYEPRSVVGEPILGKYNDYGSIEDIVETPFTKTLEEFFGLSIDDILDCIERVGIRGAFEYNQWGELVKHFGNFDKEAAFSYKNTIDDKLKAYGITTKVFAGGKSMAYYRDMSVDLADDWRDTQDPVQAIINKFNAIIDKRISTSPVGFDDADYDKLYAICNLSMVMCHKDMAETFMAHEYREIPQYESTHFETQMGEYRKTLEEIAELKAKENKTQTDISILSIKEASLRYGTFGPSYRKASISQLYKHIVNSTPIDDLFESFKRVGKFERNLTHANRPLVHISSYQDQDIVEKMDSFNAIYDFQKDHYKRCKEKRREWEDEDE